MGLLVVLLIVLVSGYILDDVEASANVVLSPSDASTRLGHTLLLPCVVVTGDNSTAVHVTWQHNGVDIGATPHFQVHTLVTPQRSGTTIIKSVLDVCVTATDVAGNYSCTAVAGESILDQEAFRIHVEPAHAPVRIIVAPGNTTVGLSEGNTNTIAVICVAAGLPLPHITWQQNGYLISSSSLQYIHEKIETRNGLEIVIAKLAICPFHAKQGGQYTCQAQNQHSSVEAFFTIATPPVSMGESSKMKNVTIDKASEHALSCDFFGYPSPIVSWTFNGQPTNIEAFHTHQMPAIRPRGEIVTTSYLRFTPRSLLYSGSYRCMAAENALHMTEIQVYIQVPAEIMVGPVGPSHGLTSSVIVSCVAYGVPSPAVVWKHDNSIVTAATIQRRSQQLNGIDVVTSSLELCADEDTTSGRYSCEVENGVADLQGIIKSAAFDLCFTGNFGLLVTPASGDIVAGGVYYLPCVAYSNDGNAITITWGSARLNGEASKLTTIEKNATQNGIFLLISILELSCASIGDATEYTCSATDGVESSQESFTLRFTFAPVIENQHGDTGPITVLQNGDYSFPSCIVSGLPIPTVTWLKNGNPLENDDSTSIQESFIMEAGTTSINSTLILSGLTVKDNGYYVCRAENYLARVDMAKGYTLTVKGTPTTDGVRNKAIQYASYSGSILCILPLVAVAVIHLASSGLWSDGRGGGVCALFSSLFHLSFLFATFSCFNLVFLRPLRNCSRAKLAYVIAIFLNWGIPLLLLVASLVPDVSNYINDNVCIPLHWPLWFGLLLPFAASHALSWILLIVIPFTSLCRTKTDKRPTASCSPVLREALAIGSVLFLFDLAWVLQITALSTNGSAAMTTASQSVFVASSACLGVVSLLYFCFLQPHVRRILFHCNSPEKTQEISSSESTASQTSGSKVIPVIDKSFPGENGVVNKSASL